MHFSFSSFENMEGMAKLLVPPFLLKPSQAAGEDLLQLRVLSWHVIGLVSKQGLCSAWCRDLGSA